MNKESPATTTMKKRAQWTSQQMESAVKMVERGMLSTYASAARYNIPRRTLRNHLTSGSTIRKLGRSAIFTAEQEAGLVRRIIRLADVGVSLTSKMLRIQAFSFCQINTIPNTFNNSKNTAGKKWLKLFLKRHLELASRKAQMINPARAQKLNKNIVGDHFLKYKSILDRHGMEHKPESIYNVDEKNCRISLHHQQAVLAARGKKRVRQIANEHAESVTVVGCGNALGSVIPPMILFKGKRLKPEFTDNLPPGSLVKMTPKGSMTTLTFIEFINHLHKYRTSGPCLLIFDGAKCHLDFTIVEEADKCGITLYCLPSNTTHELQPMDKSVYRSFEHHWDQELIKYINQHPDRTINKTSFNVIISQVWPKCMTISNISNGFRATGLYPYNPEAIPEEAFAPSALSELPNPTSSQNIAVLSAEPRDREISTATVEDLDDSGTDTENLPLSLLPKNNSISETPHKSVNQINTTCEIHDFLPTPKFKVNNTAPRKKSLNYRAQEVTKDLFGGNATTSTLEILPSSKLESTPGTSFFIKTKKSTPKSTSVIDCTSALFTIEASPNPTSLRNASLTADKLTASKPSNKTSWFCPACKEDRVDDMRQCPTCGVWYHELCVGLTPEDKIFYCSGDCMKKKMKKAD